jgi:type I restriction enzyme S subunit
VQTGPFGAQLHADDYVEQGVPFILIKNIKDGYLDPSGMPNISTEDATRLSVYRLEAGDVVFSRVGRVGSCFLAEEHHNGWVISGQLLRLRPTKNSIDGRFLLHWLLSSFVKDHITCASVGTTRQSINTTILGNVPVPLLPLPEQRRIAEILDTLDEAIRKTEQVIAKLQQIKQGLLHDLLTRGIDENCELRDPDLHPEQFKDSPLGRIPRGWEVLSALSVASKESGSTTIGPFGSNLKADDYQPDGVPVVFVRDIRDTGFEWNSNVYLSDSKALALSAHGVLHGDVLATKMGLPPCIAATYPSWMPPGIITADIVRLRPDTNIANSVWLATYLNSPRVRLQVRAITGGVTRPKITLADFRHLQLAVPPLTEQGRLLHLLDEIDIRVQREHDDALKLRCLKQGLMDDLLTGRVRVPVEPEAAAA